MKQYDYSKVSAFDDNLGGPSISIISSAQEGPGTLSIPDVGVGFFDVHDRDVFRPLQYCAAQFDPRQIDAGWATRYIVFMSSLYLESLVKRIGFLGNLPLGASLKHKRIKKRLEPEIINQLERFAIVYNEAKHDFDHDKDTHRFTIEDALLAYFVSRQLGMKLYSLAHLKTDIGQFDRAKFNSESS